MQEQGNGSVNILVVEDECVIGMFIQDTLEMAGFNVQLAATAGEARRKFSAVAASFDAAVIDIGLPDEPGDRFATEVRGLHPELPIVMATAARPQVLAGKFDNDSRLRVLEKPYDGTELMFALSALHVHPGSRTRQ